MRSLCIGFVVCALWPLSVLANPADLVGRLNIGRGGFCTATLIDASTILTAAHCVLSPGGPRSLAAMRFFLALGDQGAMAARHITHVAVPEAFRESNAGRLNNDIALARLDAPLDVGSLGHLRIGVLPSWAAQVQILRYDRINANHITSQTCQIEAREAQAALLSCNVDSGASGAPVFVRHDGSARLAAVVSRKVSQPQTGTLVTALQDALALLYAKLP